MQTRQKNVLRFFWFFREKIFMYHKFSHLTTIFFIGEKTPEIFYKICDGTNRLKTPIFHYNQPYLRLKSKQSIDMAGPCSILMDFDYTEAKLWRIRPFSSYFCSLLLRQDFIVLRQDSIVLRQDSIVFRQDCIVLRQDSIVVWEDSTVVWEDSIVVREDSIVL